MCIVCFYFAFKHIRPIKLYTKIINRNIMRAAARGLYAHIRSRSWACARDYVRNRKTGSPFGNVLHFCYNNVFVRYVVVRAHKYFVIFRTR